MRWAVTASTIVLLACSICSTANADEPQPQPTAPRGFTLDIGQFAPQARGIVIQIGREPDGTGRFRLDIPQRDVHLDLRDDGKSPLGGLDLSRILPRAQPPAAQPTDPNDPLEPNIDLGEPSVELGEAEGAAPSQDTTDPSPQPTSPSAEGDVQLGEPQSEPLIVPEAPEPGAPLSTDVEDAPMPATRAGFLGVVGEPVPEALAAQFAALLPSGGGLLVTRVVPDSPAAAAGLQPHDILIRYNETSVTSLEQLTGLARGDEPGTEVKLQIIRAGQTLDLQVALGDAPVPIAATAPAQSSSDSGLPPTFGDQLALSSGTIDVGAVGAEVAQKLHHLLTTYRIVSVDYASLPGGQYQGLVTLSDRSGNVFELPAAGNETEIQLQLARQLLELP